MKSASSLPEPTPLLPRPVRPRRSNRRLRWLIPLVGLLIVGGAYATLPLWLPRDWLRDRVAADLSRSLGCTVHLGSLNVGWKSGVAVGTIVVADPSGGRRPLLEVTEVRTELNPIRALIGGGLDQLELHAPTLHVVIDQSGRLNLGRLRLNGSGRPPARRINIQDARVELIDSRVDRTTDVRFGDVLLTFDARTGHTHVELQGEFIRSARERPSANAAEPGRFASEASLQVPGVAESNGDASSDTRLAPADAARIALGGEGYLRWDRVDLSSIPTWLVPGWDDVGLGGLSSGNIRATVGRDLEQRFEVVCKLADLSLARGSTRALSIPRASLLAAGRWRPGDELLELSSLRLDLPGAVVEKRPTGGIPQSSQTLPLVWTRRSATPVRLAVHGSVKDLDELLAWLPRRFASMLVRPNAASRARTERIEFTLGLRRTAGATHVEFKLDGEGAGVRVLDRLVLDPGARFSAALDASFDDRLDAVELQRADVRLGPWTLKASGRFPVVPAADDATRPSAESEPMRTAFRWLDTLDASRRMEFSLIGDDLSDLSSRIPALASALHAWRLGGRASASVSLAPAPGGTAVTAELSCDDKARVEWPGVFVKTPGRRFSATIQATYPHQAHAYCRDARVRLIYGGGELVTLATPGRHGPMSLLRCDRVRGGTDGAEPTTAAVRDAAEDDFALAIQLVHTLRARGLDEWIAMFPSLSAELVPEGRERARRPAGDTRPLTGETVIRIQADAAWPLAAATTGLENARVSCAVDASQSAVALPNVLTKAPGEPADLMVAYSFGRRRPRDTHRLQATAEFTGVRLSLDAARGGMHASMELSGQIDDVGALSRHVPLLAEAVRKADLRGGGAFRLEMLRAGDAVERSVQFDLTELAAVIANPNGTGLPLIGKARGVPCRAVLTLRQPDESGPGEATPGAAAVPRWLVERAEFTLAGCRLVVRRGEVVLAPDAAARIQSPFLGVASNATSSEPPMRRLMLDGDAEVMFDTTLRSFSPDLARWADEHDLLGSCALHYAIDARPDAVAMQGDLDAARLAATWPGLLRKPAGHPAALRWNATLSPRSPRTSLADVLTCRLQECAFSWNRSTGRAAGEFWLSRNAPLREPGAAWSPYKLDGAEGSLSFTLTDLHELYDQLDPALLARLVPVQPEGGSLSGRLAARWDGRSVYLGPSTLRIDGLAARWSPPNAAPQLPIRADGSLLITADSVQSNGLTLSAGRSDFMLAGHVENRADRLRGTLVLSARTFDAVELTASLDSSTATRPAATAPAAAPAWWPSMVAFARKCDLTVAAHSRSARVPGFARGAPLHLDELAVDLACRSATLDAAFTSAAEGGLVTGTLRLPLDEPDPRFDLAYSARDLRPTDATRPIVEEFFPGMVVAGRITLVDQSHQRLFPVDGRAAYPTGSGEMIINGGTMVGRAAPLWVTRAFPGLNMARFDFERMVNRFQKFDDGVHHNSMTFLGPYYHLYVEGTSDADGRIRYEVGVDLLARVSPDLSRLGQGRVALFNKTGRTRDGRLEDEVVSYLTPAEVTRKILTNNLLTTAYYAVKRRVASP